MLHIDQLLLDSLSCCEHRCTQDLLIDRASGGFADDSFFLLEKLLARGELGLVAILLNKGFEFSVLIGDGHVLRALSLHPLEILPILLFNYAV